MNDDEEAAAMAHDDHTSESKSYLRPVEPGEPVRRPSKKPGLLAQLSKTEKAIATAAALIGIGIAAAHYIPDAKGVEKDHETLGGLSVRVGNLERVADWQTDTLFRIGQAQGVEMKPRPTPEPVAHPTPEITP